MFPRAPASRSNAAPPAGRTPSNSISNSGAAAQGEHAMKITDVTLTLFAWDGLPRLGYSGGVLPTSSNLGLLRIISDDGVEGHAFLGSASHAADQDAAGLIRYLKPILMGRDPLDRERLFQEIWARNRVASIRTIGAVDVALWDLAGKAVGLPVHRLLGTYRNSIPAYASSAAL